MKQTNYTEKEVQQIRWNYFQLGMVVCVMLIFGIFICYNIIIGSNL